MEKEGQGSPRNPLSAELTAELREISNNLRELSESLVERTEALGEALEEYVEESIRESVATESALPVRAADPSAVRQLARITISEAHMSSSSCPICLEAFKLDEKARQLPCHHMFHDSCIIPWLDTRNTCPVCRFELPIKK